MSLEEKILNHYGWDVETCSPLEIRNEHGSFASGEAAHYVLDALTRDYKVDVIQEPITLTFGVDNHFDPVSLGRNEEGERFDFATNANWLIGCAKEAMDNSNFPPHSPRRIEMNKLCWSLKKQLREQLTFEQCEELKLNS